MMLELPYRNSRSNLNEHGMPCSSASSPRQPIPYQPIVYEIHPEKTLTYYIHKLILHVSFHITLISILEPLFFFYFAIPMESDLFYNELESFTHYQHKIMESHSAQMVRSQTFYDLFITFLEYENAEIDTMLTNMHNNAVHAKHKNDEYNNSLQEMSYIFPALSGSFTILYYTIVQLIYKYKSIGAEVLGEHLILMLFVAGYEFWFFTHVILKYIPFTTEEVMNFMINCFFVRIFEYYPELTLLQHNTTAVCSP